MLTITIPATEKWDTGKREFIYTREYTLKLEHSLVSISKWEANWCKPFLSKKPKTVEETIDYIKCMTLTQNVPDEAYENITNENIKEVSAYIEQSRTASWFSKDEKGKPSRETITSELIYYWMISNNIPVEFQKWHLSRLLTLINVCRVKNSPPKKVGQTERLSRNARLNAERKKRMGTKG